MRNYEGYRIGDRVFTKKAQTECKEMTSVGKAPCRDNKKLVIEENTIYEIDLDCMDCLEKRQCD